MKSSFTVSGQIVDLIASRIFPGTVTIEEGKIVSVQEGKTQETQYIMPGFVDAHVHVESSMLVPSEFARLAVVHGTVATVSDPHEIANVLGMKGVKFMIANGKQVPFKFFFGAPSCVPATAFETSGATLNAKAIGTLMKMDDIYYLSEMMNFPGVLADDPEILRKIAFSAKANKPVDGHAPGLSGEGLKKYVEAGISTDHECSTLSEGEEKVNLGMKILIREGSAAKNFNALIPLMGTHPEMLMFCSDDKHPDELAKGHINQLVQRSLTLGYDVIDVLRAASLNTIKHYKLNVGLLQEGDDADFIIVDNLEEVNVLKTYIKGECVAENGVTLIESQPSTEPNIFVCDPIDKKSLAVHDEGGEIRVIDCMNKELLTRVLTTRPKVEEGLVVSDTDRDLLKLVVINRYQKAKPAIAFIHNFGLKHGAIASSVAHDSHNLVAVGVTDDDLVRAINILIENRGGVVTSSAEEIVSLALPVAGLMSTRDGYRVAAAYEHADALAHRLGTKLDAPFMTLAFMPLLVIPELKLSDKGLFDVNKFGFTSLFVK